MATKQGRSQRSFHAVRNERIRAYPDGPGEWILVDAVGDEGIGRTTATDERGIKAQLADIAVRTYRWHRPEIEIMRKPYSYPYNSSRNAVDEAGRPLRQENIQGFKDTDGKLIKVGDMLEDTVGTTKGQRSKVVGFKGTKIYLDNGWRISKSNAVLTRIVNSRARSRNAVVQKALNARWRIIYRNLNGPFFPYGKETYSTREEAEKRAEELRKRGKKWGSDASYFVDEVGNSKSANADTSILRETAVNATRSTNAVVAKAMNAQAVCNASYSAALKAIMDAVKPYMDRRITDDTSWRYPALVISKLRDVCERAVMSAGRYDGKRPPHRVYDVECVKDGFKFSGNLIVSGLLHRDDPDDVSAFDEYDMILSLGYAGKA